MNKLLWTILLATVVALGVKASAPVNADSISQTNLSETGTISHTATADEETEKTDGDATMPYTTGDDSTSLDDSDTHKYTYEIYITIDYSESESYLRDIMRGRQARNSFQDGEYIAKEHPNTKIGENRPDYQIIDNPTPIKDNKTVKDSRKIADDSNDEKSRTDSSDDDSSENNTKKRNRRSGDMKVAVDENLFSLV